MDPVQKIQLWLATSDAYQRAGQEAKAVEAADKAAAALDALTPA